MLSQLENTLTWSRERDYIGWDLYDGESSRILQTLPINNKWLNLIFQQTVRRAPVNIRPLLLVEQRQSFKGTALFVLANLGAYELTGKNQYYSDAQELADWLIENRSTGYSGYCGGHKHPLQLLDRRAHPNYPGVVGTSYAVKALLVAGEYINDEYRKQAQSAADFVFQDLDYTTHPDGACISYVPGETKDYYTINANALGARLLIDLYDAFEIPKYREGAEQILDYVAAQQTEDGGWMYRDPPEASHLNMDNFHNGFVIESFLRYGEVCDKTRYEETVTNGIEFYRTLFGSDGEPYFDEANRYPLDIHSSAQGGIVFSMLGDEEFAHQILEWACKNLSNGQGRFYHEKRRFYTKRITYMRWCQAWMAYALSEFAKSKNVE